MVWPPLAVVEMFVSHGYVNLRHVHDLHRRQYYNHSTLKC